MLLNISMLLYDILKGSGFFILLTDSEGCILMVIGDHDILLEAAKMNMVVGAYMDEKSIGTNAMGIAIKEDIPIQISAKEHFITAYHRWTCSAAPIHDIEGHIIGTLNLTGQRDLVHPHTLGLAVAAVKSIENQIKVEATNKKLLEAYHYMNGIVDSISSGIYVVDREGLVKSINKSAYAILRIKEEDIVDKSAESILPNWREIFKRLEHGLSYVDKEAVLNDAVVNGRYNVNATPIWVDEKIIGMVIVFKEIQQVFNLVNKYSGMRAVYTFNDIVGSSKQLMNVIEYSKSVANSPSTVLIEGESGTGKELLAQSIHNASDRRDTSFIAVNCGAIPKSLIESELFGYEDGAYTGARRGGHAGKFELANGGTIFLDEISEMPLDMQVNLLRVLQEGYVTRVGGDKMIPVDVRIIAATNKNLKDEIEKGTFRDDLYYRISVIPIKLPPLRERIGDMPILIKYYLRNKAQKLNKPIPEISQDTIGKMLEYSWPGNIRELENYIENLVNFNGVANVQLQLERYRSESFVCFDLDSEIEDCTLEEHEYKIISALVAKNIGNMSKVARILGISRSTLYSKLKKHDIKETIL